MAIRSFLSEFRVKGAAACLVGTLHFAFSLPAFAADPTVKISVPEAIQQFAAGKDVVFVDVRPADSFARVHIPRSLNIPLYAVKTKTFLRDKTIILVNEGFQARDLEAACAALVAGGMRSAAVLAGGIASWADQGGSLEGDPVHLREIRLVPQLAHAAERERSDLLTVFVGERAQEASGLLPGAIVVPFGVGGEEFLGRLGKAAGLTPDGGVATVLLVDDAGKDYERLRFVHNAKRSRTARPVNLYFLADGLEGVRRFQELQAAIVAGKDKKKVGGCPTCPQGQSP